jgi:hypothetical protein
LLPEPWLYLIWNGERKANNYLSPQGIKVSNCHVKASAHGNDTGQLMIYNRLTFGGRI